MRKRRSIKDLIFLEYRKAAFIPIVVIELALLWMYFGITSYIQRSSISLIDKEASRSIGEIASREAKNIVRQIEGIERLSGILQKEGRRFFSSPEAFPLPAGVPSFGLAPNGVFYKTRDNGGSSLWYSADTRIGPAERAKATATEAFDPLFRAAQESDAKIVAVYFNSFDSMCRYYPFLPKVYTVFDPHMDIPGFNFYYTADAAHNPSRLPIWTDTYLDPAGQGWMASCVVPIYRGMTLEGVTGIDITIDSIVSNILDLSLPWDGSAFLVDKAGVIIAMPEPIESALGLKELRAQVYESTVKQDTVKPEEFNLFKNRDPGVAAQIRAIFGAGGLVHDFSIGAKTWFLTDSIIESTGWHMMTLVDKAIVRAPIVRLDALAKRFGYIAFLSMLAFYTVFFALLLYRARRVADRISRPIIFLAGKSTEMRTSPGTFSLESAGSDIEEVSLLYSNFGAMAQELAKLYTGLEDEVELRTKELKAANEELNKAYVQITQQEKMASIGQLAAGVAHEINNPMGFVMSNVETMKDYWKRMTRFVTALSGGKEGGVDVDGLRRELDVDFMLADGDDLFRDTIDGTLRVKNIVSELRSFARSSDSSETVDINRLVESVLKITASEMRHKVELSTQLGELPAATCNQGQLNQVFLNILVNAIQAIPEKGRIEIRSWAEEGWINVSFRDSGSGIAPETLGRIFEPFFTTKEVGKGTGLGLAVSYAIMKQHGGSIEVESEPGKGSCFTVRIPVGGKA